MIVRSEKHHQIKTIIHQRKPSKLTKIAQVYDINNIFATYDSITFSYILPYYKVEQMNSLFQWLERNNNWRSLAKITKYLPKNHKYFIERTYNKFTDINIILRDCNEFIQSNSEVSICNFIINFDFNPYEFLYNGLLPYMDHFNNHYKQMFLVAVKDEIPDNVMEFFYGNTAYNYLKKRRWWTMRTLKDIQEEISSTTSLSLMFSYPHMLYTISSRPKTTMDIFRTPLSLTGKIREGKLQVNDNTYHIYNKNNVKLPIAVPVVRYSKGVDVGLYFAKKSKKPICGTFYYYEPESATYLICDVEILIAKTKTSAAKILLENHYNEELEYLYTDIMSREDIRDYENGLLHEDMKYTPSEAKRELGYISRQFKYNIEDYPMYLGSSSLIKKNTSDQGMYSAEDDFDQPLCVELFKQGYDLAILTNMIGAFQVVTEILDTRERSISFSNLIYT